MFLQLPVCSPGRLHSLAESCPHVSMGSVISTSGLVTRLRMARTASPESTQKTGQPNAGKEHHQGSRSKADAGQLESSSNIEPDITYSEEYKVTSPAGNNTRSACASHLSTCTQNDEEHIRQCTHLDLIC